MVTAQNLLGYYGPYTIGNMKSLGNIKHVAYFVVGDIV
jgi:hypothetical protein